MTHIGEKGIGQPVRGAGRPVGLRARVGLARVFAVAVLGAGGVPAAQAQASIVVPPSHAVAEGTGATNVPFGRSVPMRVQMAYDGVAFPGPLNVTRLGFRADGAASPSAKLVDFELRLSTMAYGVTAIQPYFAANRGPDETVVFARRSLQLPGAAAQSPAPFSLQLPLDLPFAYDPASGALVVEAIVHGQAPGTYTLDATYLCTSPLLGFGPPGCGPRITMLSSRVVWGGALQVQVEDVAPGAATALLLGSIESGTWGGVPIPLDLAPFGAPGCHLATDPLAGWAAAADASGVAAFPLRLPSQPRLQYGWLRFQGLAIDRAANPLGVVTSAGGKVQVCGWEPVSRVFAPSLTAASGSREIGVAPVVEVGVR